MIADENKKISAQAGKGEACIYIMTGEINTGKTTRLLSKYNEIKSGDGFIISKVFHAGQYIGQKIVRLSTGESEYFSFKKEFIPSDWDEAYCYNIYSFSKKGLQFADKIVSDIITKGIEPVFIDEIGPLELQERGFAKILTQVLSANKDICITIRNSCVERVIKKFNIEKYKIIDLDVLNI